MHNIATRSDDAFWFLVDERQGTPAAWNFTSEDGRPPVLSLVGCCDDTSALQQARSVFGYHFRPFPATEFVERLVSATESHGIDNLFMFTRDPFVPRALRENSISISSLIADARVVEFAQSVPHGVDPQFAHDGQNRVPPLTAPSPAERDRLALQALLTERLRFEIKRLEASLRLSVGR